MAIARPVRALGLAAIVMWCFFIWQLFKPTASPAGPGKTGLSSSERDPNLDRKNPCPYPGSLSSIAG
jgi:mannosyltransferase